MLTGASFDNLRALLDWQVELGADEAILDHPLDRYALEAQQKAPSAPVKAAPPPAAPQVDAVAEAEAAAARASDLAALETALAAFPHCELRRGATSTVFAEGRAEARVMVIGEAPDRDEDRAGRPFAGAPGQLLDAMFAAIGLSRDAPDAERALYLAAAIPWRPTGDLPPEPADLAMIRPFVERHIALAQPDVLVLMGALPCEMLLGQGGVRRIRGQWQEVLGRPALPMLHPRDLLDRPEGKRDAWADLLALKRALQG